MSKKQSKNTDLVSQAIRSIVRATGYDAKDFDLINAIAEPSPRIIRQESRKRGLHKSIPEIVDSAPDEKRYVFRMEQTIAENIKSEKYFVVFMDPDGRVLEIIESR